MAKNGKVPKTGQKRTSKSFLDWKKRQQLRSEQDVVDPSMFEHTANDTDKLRNGDNDEDDDDDDDDDDDEEEEEEDEDEENAEGQPHGNPSSSVNSISFKPIAKNGVNLYDGNVGLNNVMKLDPIQEHRTEDEDAYLQTQMVDEFVNHNHKYSEVQYIPQPKVKQMQENNTKAKNKEPPSEQSKQLDRLTEAYKNKTLSEADLQRVLLSFTPDNDSNSDIPEKDEPNQEDEDITIAIQQKKLELKNPPIKITTTLLKQQDSSSPVSTNIDNEMIIPPTLIDSLHSSNIPSPPSSYKRIFLNIVFTITDIIDNCQAKAYEYLCLAFLYLNISIPKYVVPFFYLTSIQIFILTHFFVFFLFDI
ncbi:hypothetical protein TBLA_0B09170 [Henningerozyma blattae CBS 6284]|uniref:Uncharacterized protein n=1 Tax=Henningerozyma blattae (strain ATCC 34711 / CBS 6284 / DSM 70876 / NBRC 10599 / NRRL Y-10934 / UCD 77-7) TaxID=1071380 RepID=I2H030_HENB6|nr:hypothetical protein TBLA_0B09170 [Tetrapisispora blattae CBS 6284]CCH59732.1 hypothetical protein TBLA_0B09170 [Tetrapisispora blattae CBS 6284]